MSADPGAAMPKTAYFHTYTGRMIYLPTVTPEEIEIEDIAHGLANICRYGGQCEQFYSVAQHSLRVASLVPPAWQLCALLHDATEAYIGDIPTPLKRLLPDYQEFERVFWEVIAERFDLPRAMPGEVKAADYEVLKAEAREMTTFDLGGSRVMPIKEFLAPDEARHQFLGAFYQLGGGAT